tara:strand:- start:275 stop:397 length:123 start_codon:yes stop_codon:yes gene_type:complete
VLIEFDKMKKIADKKTITVKIIRGLKCGKFGLNEICENFA